jgi:endonuclease YncB( thermonuclease family)
MIRFAIFLLLLILSPFSTAAWGQVSGQELATVEARCTRVVDGDTIQLRGGETVRLLGIDTPELGEPFSRDAKLFTLSLVAHTTLRLEFDEQLRDSYGRLLAFVYAETEDGLIMVNEEIVRAGLARLLFYAPNELHRDILEAAFREAVVARRGMWGAIPGTLSVEELEVELVRCVTEVVTVAFDVADVVETDEYIVLHASGSEYGLHAQVPHELVSTLGIDPIEDLMGACVTVTGFLDCDVGGSGPVITIDDPDQLVVGCSPPPEG